MSLQRTREHPRAVLAVWRRTLWHNAHALARAAVALYRQGSYAPAGFMALSAVEEVARSVIVLEAELEHRTHRPTAPTLAEVRCRTGGRLGRQLEAIIASFFLDIGAETARPGVQWARGQRLRRQRRSLLTVGLGRQMSLPHGRCTAEDAYALVRVAYEALAEQAVHCADDHPPTGLGSQFQEKVRREFQALDSSHTRATAQEEQG